MQSVIDPVDRYVSLLVHVPQFPLKKACLNICHFVRKLFNNLSVGYVTFSADLFVRQIILILCFLDNLLDRLSGSLGVHHCMAIFTLLPAVCILNRTVLDPVDRTKVTKSQVISYLVLCRLFKTTWSRFSEGPTQVCDEAVYVWHHYLSSLSVVWTQKSLCKVFPVAQMMN